MNDPHVAEMTYLYTSLDATLQFAPDAPDIEVDLGEFRCRLRQGVITVQPRRHFSQREEAVRALSPFLDSWTSWVELNEGRRIKLTFQSARVVDRNPTSGFVHAQAEVRITGSAFVQAQVVKATYFRPPPPWYRDTALVLILNKRVRNVRDGRESPLAVGYWFVTMLESTYDGRKNAAQRLHVSSTLLGDLARICSIDDPEIGRKASGRETRRVTESERRWVSEAPADAHSPRR